MVETAIVAFERVLVADGLLTLGDAAPATVVLVDATGAPLAVGVRR